MLCSPCQEDTDGECEITGRRMDSGDSFNEGCHSCVCRGGRLNCDRREGCSVTKPTKTAVHMRFSGNQENYDEKEEREDFVRFFKTFLMSKFKDLNLRKEQITNVDISVDSDIQVSCHLVNKEDSADASVVAATLESEYNSGSLVLVHNSAVLAPSGSFISQEISIPNNPQNTINLAAIVVPVVLGCLLILTAGVVVAAVVRVHSILYVLQIVSLFFVIVRLL
jgi:hypothetical protein